MMDENINRVTVVDLRGLKFTGAKQCVYKSVWLRGTVSCVEMQANKVEAFAYNALNSTLSLPRWCDNWFEFQRRNPCGFAMGFLMFITF